MNRKPYTKLWAILSVDTKGNEGVCALAEADLPCITGDLDNLEMLKKLVSTPQARGEAKDAGYKIVVAEFTRSKTVDL